MKTILITFGAIILLTVGSSVDAAEKMITLSDGSVIKGELLGLTNGVYTIRTADLGVIELNEEKVLRISAPHLAESSPQSAADQKYSLKEQTAQMQGEILGDEMLMEEIKSLLNDPQIYSIMSDPDLLKDVLTYDEETIRNNPSIQRLMQNPRFMEMIRKIEQQVGQP